MSDVSFSDNKVSGIYGKRDLDNIKGWENYTTGLGGSVKVRLGHAQGVPSFDHNTVSIDEPLRLGRFIGVWLRKPNFFHESVLPYWDVFLQDKILEVSGVQDNEIGVISKTTGSVQRNEDYAGSYKEGNGKFTIKVPEVKGSPVRKIMKYYISGISDPVTGTAHFHGNNSLRFSKVNYGGDFLYILLGPTMRPDDIEYACLWVNAFPTKDFIGHLNSGAIGEPGSGDLSFDIEFSGSYIQNNAVNKMAQLVTQAVGLYKDTNEDVVLPSYIYKNYLDPSKLSKITAEFGSDIISRINNASADVTGTGSEDSIANVVTGYSDTKTDGVPITPVVPSPDGGTGSTIFGAP